MNRFSLSSEITTRYKWNWTLTILFERFICSVREQFGCAHCGFLLNWFLFNTLDLISCTIVIGWIQQEHKLFQRNWTCIKTSEKFRGSGGYIFPRTKLEIIWLVIWKLKYVAGTYSLMHFFSWVLKGKCFAPFFQKMFMLGLLPTRELGPNNLICLSLHLLS